MSRTIIYRTQGNMGTVIATYSTGCLVCPKVLEMFEEIKKMLIDQKEGINEIKSSGIEELEYVKRIQNDSTVRKGLMDMERAPASLAEEQILLPISDMLQFDKVNDLLGINSTIREALVS
ncbi:hypothetical protein ACFFRR_009131 [Megaselia abdita]